ncbi:MAG: replication initiator protein A [Armatimonadetes bacterium]|nr:replication initiator protein A [Armatimonadota bacterium]
MSRRDLQTALQPVGKDEMNLAEYPFALLTRRMSENQKTIEVEQQVRADGGEVVTQSWVVTGSDRYGLPLAVDEDIYIALMKILKDSGFRDRTIPFTRYQILKILGKDVSKREYDRIQQSLDRLVGTTITSKNAFWDNRARSYVSKAFHIFESYELYREQPGRKSARAPELPMSYVVLSSFLFESIKAGYVKNLDIEFYLSLDTPLAKRLFRFLDKKAYNNRSFEIGVMRLAVKLPVHDPYPSQVKRRLDEAHGELVSKGFLADVRYDRRRDGEEKVVYTFARPRMLLPEEPDAPVAPLVGELVARGITRTAAETLVAAHSEEHIGRHIAAFDRLQAEQSARIRRNPAGYLRRAIEEDYAVPEAKKTRRACPAPSVPASAGDTPPRRRRLRGAAPLAPAGEETPPGAGNGRRRDGIRPERLAELREEACRVVQRRYPVLAQRPSGPAFAVMVEACVDEILAAEPAAAVKE